MERIELDAKAKLDRDAWLNQALEVLRTEGIQGVRVERLARDLGVTKGSFYWHFKDRPDLRQQILDYWIQQFTEVIVDSDEFLEGDPADGLLAAITRVRSEGLEKYELAIRAWADQDPLADKIVRQVYSRRTEFIRGFFRRMGFRGMDAEIRTRLSLCYLSWEPNMYPNETPARQVKLLRLQHELLTRKP